MDDAQQNLFTCINKKPKKAFTPVEDQQIIFFVNLLGTKKWSLISKYVNSRTAKQCRDRYMNYLKPGLSNMEWTKSEDDLLLNLYRKFGSKWSIKSNYFNNRNQISLKNRTIFLHKQIYQQNMLSYKNNQKNNINDFRNHQVKNKIKQIIYPLPDIKSGSKLDVDNNHGNRMNNSTINSIEYIDFDNNNLFSNLDNTCDFPDEFYDF